MTAKNATAGNPPRFPRYTREQAKKDAADRIRRAAILPAASTLAAAHTIYGSCVIDSDGGTWWPDDEAQDEIAASADPSATAIRICETEPMRGVWAV